MSSTSVTVSLSLIMGTATSTLIKARAYVVGNRVALGYVHNLTDAHKRTNRKLNGFEKGKGGGGS